MIISNKLGLSCAKLRAILDLPGFDHIYAYFDWLTWFGFANMANEFNKTLVKNVQFGRALSLVSSRSLQVPKNIWSKKIMYLKEIQV